MIDVGGRGSGSGGSGGGGSLAKHAISQDGSVIDLSDSPLQYGKLDSAISGKARAALEAQEIKRLSAKVEHAYVLDADGNPVGKEIRGGKHEAKVPYWMYNVNDGTFTHNHPRTGDEAGILGGSFSIEDINVLTGGSLRTLRASASEGTYSITKGKNFDAKGLMSFRKSLENRIRKKSTAKVDATYERYKRGEITYADFVNAYKKNANAALVELHNELLANQKKYGYTYTLERRA